MEKCSGLYRSSFKIKRDPSQERKMAALEFTSPLASQSLSIKHQNYEKRRDTNSWRLTARSPLKATNLARDKDGHGFVCSSGLLHKILWLPPPTLVTQKLISPSLTVLMLIITKKRECSRINQLLNPQGDLRAACLFHSSSFFRCSRNSGEAKSALVLTTKSSVCWQKSK